MNSSRKRVGVDSRKAGAPVSSDRSAVAGLARGGNRQLALFRQSRPVAYLSRVGGLKPRRFLRLMRVLASHVLDYVYDMRRYLRFSGTLEPYSSRSRLEGKLIMNYHRLEKALALREPRQGFGQVTASTLLADLRRYIDQFEADQTVQVSLNVLEVYASFHRRAAMPLPEFETEISALRSRIAPTTSAGGTILLNSSEIRSAASGSFAELVKSRHSVRQFSPEPVDPRDVEEAVRLALHTPSVCNRQMWRVRVYDGVTKERVLALQNGNRGFGNEAPMLLVVTGDLQYFFGSGERNQVYIDGGMFAMTLIHALHYLGLGTCALNLSVGRRIDHALRSIARIPPSETFIMMIAVGHLEETFPVACSARRSVEEVLKVGVVSDETAKLNARELLETRGLSGSTQGS